MDLLETAIRRNPDMIRTAAELHITGEIPVNTYLIDLDTVKHNAEIIKKEVDKAHVTAYLCAKQIGRNPLVCKAIVDSGIGKAIALDIEGIKALNRYRIPIAHVGHFGQIPTSEIRYVLEKVNPEVITVFSFEKAKQISDIASKLGRTQDLLVKILAKPYHVRNPVPGGFTTNESISIARRINQLDGVKVVGVTTYPACDFDIRSKEYALSANFVSMMNSARELKRELGIEIQQINAAGRNCVQTTAILGASGATHIEPGHAFTGTLPDMAFYDASEIPAVCYVSEISHMVQDLPLMFADSMMTTAMIGSIKNVVDYERIHTVVGTDPDTIIQNKVPAVPQEYWHNDATWHMYCALLPEHNAKLNVGDTVVAAFRPQIYRAPGSARVAVVSGIQRKKPKLLGLFDRSGLLLDRESENPIGLDTSAVHKLMNALQS
jgi:predicted amino acid racemase